MRKGGQFNLKRCTFCKSRWTITARGVETYSYNTYEEEVPYEITHCIRCGKTEELGGENEPLIL